MATREWHPATNSDGNWLNAANWAGGVIPQFGDTVNISVGPYPLTPGSLSGITVNVFSAGNNHAKLLHGTSLSLVNNTKLSITATNTAGSELDYSLISVTKGASLNFISNGAVVPSGGYETGVGTFQAPTNVVNNGLIELSNTGVAFSGPSFDNEAGAIVAVNHSNLLINGFPGFITNNGAILVDNGSFVQLSAPVDEAAQGHGLFTVGTNSTLEFDNSVDVWHSIYLLSPFGPSSNATLRLFDAPQFFGRVYGFDTSDRIEVNHLITVVTVLGEDQNSASISLTDPKTQPGFFAYANINLVGDFRGATFAVSHTSGPAGVISDIVRTS